MLYDPKWEVKADPLSLESLIAWLEQQPSNHFYPVTEARYCLLAQWLKSMDPATDGDTSGRHSFCYIFRGQPINLGMFRDVVLGISDLNPRTFGAALERARALAADKR